MYFATPAACAQQGTDMLRWQYFHELLEYAGGTGLPNAQPPLADTCVSESSLIEKKDR
jgi:hypothetical protein